MHGCERVTHDLYLEFLTIVGCYIYFKLTVSSLFHQAFHFALSDFHLFRENIQFSQRYFCGGTGSMSLTCGLMKLDFFPVSYNDVSILQM